MFSIFQVLAKELVSKHKKPNLSAAITKFVERNENDEEKEDVDDDGFEDVDEFCEGADEEEEKRRIEDLRFLGDRSIDFDLEVNKKNKN
jgi:hypothetical protein